MKVDHLHTAQTPTSHKIAIKPKQTQLIIQKCHFKCKYHCWSFARDTSYSVHCSESNFHIWQLSPGESCHWVPWSSSGKRHTSVILYILKLTNEETQNLDILSFWIGFKTKQNHFGVGKPDSHGIVVWLQAISEILEYSRSENRTSIYHICMNIFIAIFTYNTLLEFTQSRNIHGMIVLRNIFKTRK